MSDAVVYVGHATTLIDLDGTRLLTDPVLRPRIGHITRRVAAPEQADLDALDGILVSHAHFDHLDLPSLKRIAGASPVVVPRGLARLLLRRGIAVTQELVVGEEIRIGALSVRGVHAEHDGRRLPGGRRHPALGFVVEGSARVYFAGDTDLFDAMRDLRDIDVALIPVSGWGPRTGPGHLDPERAAEAAARIGPRVAIPIHWGTIASPGIATESLHDPPDRFLELCARTAPDVEVVVVEPGGRYELTRQRAPR